MSVKVIRVSMDLAGIRRQLDELPWETDHGAIVHRSRCLRIGTRTDLGLVKPQAWREASLELQQIGCHLERGEFNREEVFVVEYWVTGKGGEELSL